MDDVRVDEGGGGDGCKLFVMVDKNIWDGKITYVMKMNVLDVIIGLATLRIFFWIYNE